ncbi:exocyst complex component EXO84C [Forsythia ovata]|uniref:Exocyst complex component EXO84C n=1 Tax=Forsythia ovata TaxID=205694 RepID=A0ABD1WIW1_9LAMI
MQFLEHIDVLLAEHKIEEAIEAIDAEERSHPELKESRRATRVVLDLVGGDESITLSHRFATPLSTFATSSDTLFVGCGMRFIFVVKKIVEQLTHLVILHFGGNIFMRIAQLFDKYVDFLIKALTGPSEDDNLTELKELVSYKAETDSQQLALLGTAFIITEELLPMILKIGVVNFSIHWTNSEIISVDNMFYVPFT